MTIELHSLIKLRLISEAVMLRAHNVPIAGPCLFGPGAAVWLMITTLLGRLHAECAGPAQTALSSPIITKCLTHLNNTTMLGTNLQITPITPGTLLTMANSIGNLDSTPIYVLDVEYSPIF